MKIRIGLIPFPNKYYLGLREDSEACEVEVSERLAEKLKRSTREFFEVYLELEKIFTSGICNKRKEEEMKSYNVRIVEDRGKIKLGFVYGCYKVKEGWQWKDVPKSVRETLSKKLGCALLSLKER